MSGKLKEVRIRIKSVQSTQQITKAMKMVSAAKLRKATDAITTMRPYAQKLQGVLSNVVETLDGEVNLPLASTRPVDTIMMVVITSDRGLCGAYNMNIIKAALAKINGEYKSINDAGKLTVLPLGKKANEYFIKKGYKVNSDYWDVFSDLTFENVRKVSNFIQSSFVNKTLDKVDLVYSQFVNAVQQNFVVEPFLPIPKVENKNEAQKSDFIFEPQKEVLLTELMPKILNTQLYKALLDGNASEHGARMSAMDKATENAGEMLQELKIMFNQARQAAITTELSEIVSGAAALEG